MQIERERERIKIISKDIFFSISKNHVFLSFKDHNKSPTSRLIHMKQRKAHTQNKIDLIHTYEKRICKCFVFFFLFNKTFLSQKKHTENTGGSLRVRTKKTPKA